MPWNGPNAVESFGVGGLVRDGLGVGSSQLRRMGGEEDSVGRAAPALAKLRRCRVDDCFFNLEARKPNHRPNDQRRWWPGDALVKGAVGPAGASTVWQR